MEGNKRWLYLIEGIWFLCFCYIVWGCIYMFYKQVDVEKRVLRKMDRYYGTEEILMLPQRTWYRGKAVSKLTNLMNRYKKLTNRIDIENIEGEVTLSNVEFSYVENKKILKGIDIKAHKGKTTAIVGPKIGEACLNKVFNMVVGGNGVLDKPGFKELHARERIHHGTVVKIRRDHRLRFPIILKLLACRFIRNMEAATGENPFLRQKRLERRQENR